MYKKRYKSKCKGVTATIPGESQLLIMDKLGEGFHYFSSVRGRGFKMSQTFLSTVHLKGRSRWFYFWRGFGLEVLETISYGWLGLIICYVCWCLFFLGRGNFPAQVQKNSAVSNAEKRNSKKGCDIRSCQKVSLCLRVASRSFCLTELPFLNLCFGAKGTLSSYVYYEIIVQICWAFYPPGLLMANLKGYIRLGLDEHTFMKLIRKDCSDFSHV